MSGPGNRNQNDHDLGSAHAEKSRLDLDGIQKGTALFADQHYANFEQYFAELPEDADISTQQEWILFCAGEQVLFPKPSFIIWQAVRARRSPRWLKS
jgi:hypothetical protein